MFSFFCLYKKKETFFFFRKQNKNKTKTMEALDDEPKNNDNSDNSTLWQIPLIKPISPSLEEEDEDGELNTAENALRRWTKTRETMQLPIGFKEGQTTYVFPFEEEGGGEEEEEEEKKKKKRKERDELNLFERLLSGLPPLDVSQKTLEKRKKRQLEIEKDPNYIFLTLVAGFSNQSVEEFLVEPKEDPRDIVSGDMTTLFANYINNYRKYVIALAKIKIRDHLKGALNVCMLCLLEQINYQKGDSEKD